MMVGTYVRPCGSCLRPYPLTDPFLVQVLRGAHCQGGLALAEGLGVLDAPPGGVDKKKAAKSRSLGVEFESRRNMGAQKAQSGCVCRDTAC